MLNVCHRLQEGIIIINKLLTSLKYCTNSPLFVVLVSISPLFVILTSIIDIVLISVCSPTCLTVVYCLVCVLPHVLLFYNLYNLIT